jgi:putative sigma-54 modulation protein
MQINITARHLVLTPAISEYVRKKVERCERFFDNAAWAQIILYVEKYRQVAEVVIHAGKMTFRSKEESIDLYAAIDLSVDKIEKQLKKHKEISKIHRKGKSRSTSAKNGNAIGAAVSFVGQGTGKEGVISEVKRFDVKPTSVHEAIVEMELMGFKFYMFLNAETSQINVVYQRENGSYGLLEPEI